MEKFKRIITQSPQKPVVMPVGWHKRSLVWIGLAILALVADRMIPSAIWDAWYYHGLFFWIRQLYDLLLGYSPLPMVYLAAGYLMVRLIRWLREWKNDFRYTISRAVGGIAAMIFLFYLLWAFNYHQRPLSQLMGFDFEKVTPADIEAEYRRASQSLSEAASKLPLEMQDDFSIRKKAVSDGDVRKELKWALATLGLPNRGRVRVRQLIPNGILLRWNTAGIYIPQACEGHIDHGMLSAQKPFTMAHEMAHGYGVTDEGACNFIAWLACEKSENPWVRFSGALTYWKYAANEVSSDSVQHILTTFPPVVAQTMLLIRENDRKYPDLFPKYRDAIYSSYLKHHGIANGLRSYNEVVLMVQQYLKTHSMPSDTK